MSSAAAVLGKRNKKTKIDASHMKRFQTSKKLALVRPPKSPLATTAQVNAGWNCQSAAYLTTEPQIKVRGSSKWMGSSKVLRKSSKISVFLRETTCRILAGEVLTGLMPMQMKWNHSLHSSQQTMAEVSSLLRQMQ